MKKPIFEGMATAIITPTTENGIDYVAFAKLIDWQIDEGIDAIVFCGTTGEGSTLTDEEHREAISFAVKQVAGPASYGMTDTMGRMHSDAQFAGSSSVPAHVEMMGLIGAGNNPMVGMTVACAVAVNEALNK